MSHAPFVVRDHETAVKPRQAESLAIVVLTAVAVTLATTLLMAPAHNEHPAQVQPAGVAGSATTSAAAPPWTDTSVPDASAVLAGKDMPVEAPVPTF